MYICMTEEQKRIVAEYGRMMVVEFKRVLNHISDAWNWFIKSVKSNFGDLIKSMGYFQYLLPKEKFRVIRRLNKCGFSEKEINLMVYGAYHCRNNC